MVRDWGLNVNLKCNKYTSSIWEIFPEEGKLLLFPSWLEHEVDQNLSQEKRISIINYGRTNDGTSVDVPRENEYRNCLDS